MSTFTHSGDLGDIIYALPAIRASGGGELLLFEMAARTTTPMTPQRSDLIRPLLALQPYLRGCRWVDGVPHDHALNGFRDHARVDRNLADMHLATLDLGSEHRKVRWLEVDEPVRTPYRVVIHRSLRYLNPLFPWRRVLKLYANDVVMLGTPEEHRVFTRRYGEVPYLPTANLLEAARLIAGASLFIGNQSSLAAIAEGLKHRMVLEVCPKLPNCIFERMERINAWDDRVELPAP